MLNGEPEVGLCWCWCANRMDVDWIRIGQALNKHWTSMNKNGQALAKMKIPNV